MLGLSLSIGSVAILRRAGGVESQIAALFTGKPGLRVDRFSNFANLYQDSAGATPVTAYEQVVGLALDTAQGAIRGPELVSNPGPFTSATGWNDQAGGSPLTASGGNLVSTPSTTAASRADTPITTVIGKWYELVVNMVQFSGSGPTLAVLLSRSGSLVPGTAATGAVGVTRFLFLATTTSIYLTFGSNVSVAGVPNILASATIKLIDGNHLQQATTTARPKVSARVNLLTKTEDFTDAVWSKTNTSVSSVSTGVYRITASNNNAQHKLSQLCSNSFNLPYISIEVKSDGIQFVGLGESGQTGNFSSFDLVNGVKGFKPNVGRIEPLEDGWYRISTKTFGDNSNGATWDPSLVLMPNSTSNPSGYSYLGDSAKGLLIRKPQAQPVLGDVKTINQPTYQRVNTATDYDTAGFPASLVFDGVDDGLATATFTAGTLTSNMDCFVVVKRNAATNAAIAFPSTGGSSYLGLAASGSGTAANSGVGTPTYLVNGVAVPGGTTTTQGQLHTALPIGAWNVLEVRNADLSAWTAFGVGNYVGNLLNGQIEGVYLRQAMTTAERNTLRTYAGAQVGLVL